LTRTFNHFKPSTKQQETPQSFNNGWDIPGEDTDDTSGDTEEAGQESGDAASDKDDDSSATKAAVAAQVVRQELTQARTITSDLLEEVEKSLDNQGFRPRLIELRSLLDEIEKQLGN